MVRLIKIYQCQPRKNGYSDFFTPAAFTQKLLHISCRCFNAKTIQIYICDVQLKVCNFWEIVPKGSDLLNLDKFDRS